MTDKEKLYETLGELMFAVAMADGMIQDAEMKTMHQILDRHPWASTIRWSFDYERAKQSSVEENYQKAIAVCHRHGPAPEYHEFIDVMQKIAEANGTVAPEEAHLIQSFSHDLTERFRRDLERFL
ncbi:Tellurite resistance protein TerB [Catalinimonas alkaloidigena]|uniref:Tellurite resistance protein TerB n=1 Tax=Catalinimonas alkaloidigena TaxID=1075417 RepID=A0A1G9H6T9_9BACT|nr:TerB family tellurite resistance protein [Catalinimonas alkaloidigena]SDL08671.1 Tellurite resistance protein TerB [Catalinimonas alkaloidigena]